MDNEYTGRSYGGHQSQYVPANYDPNRPKLKRPTTDYGSTLAQWARYRKPRDKFSSLLEAERPSYSYIVDMTPPLARPQSAADSIPARHLHSSLNKAKYPINVVMWTPEGRRLLTASSSGEFTLWNGMSFNFELIMQAHESAVRAACYSHSEDWLISADQDGIVKYWQPNFNNVKEIQAHNETIRGLVFAPSDSKFASASDDATIKIFDFASGVEESVLTGHQWEIRSLDWHPTKGLLVSGSKDHSVKLWDPRSGRCLTTLSSSKNQVSRTLFEKTEGLLLATSGRDQIIRIFDLRMMRDVFHLRGHENEITSLAWHPLHRNLISTGGHSGAIHHYLLDEQNPPPNGAFTLSPYDSPDPQNAPTQTIYPAHSVLHAHEPTGPIWAMSWHPLGHILASGSNDRVTRFWSRPRPGETNYLNDRFHIGPEAAEARGTYNKHDRRQQRDAEEQEEEDEAEGLAEQKVPAPPLQLPGMQFPGLGPPGLAQLPGFGSIAPPPNMGGIMPPPMPGPGGFPPMPPNAAQLQGLLPPGMDLEKLKEMFGGQLPPPPPNGVPLPLPGGFPPLPGMPGMPGMPGAPPPPGFMPGMMPPPFPPPQGGPNGQFPGLDADPNGVRRRAPLPSQEEAKRQLFGRR